MDVFTTNLARSVETVPQDAVWIRSVGKVRMMATTLRIGSVLAVAGMLILGRTAWQAAAAGPGEWSTEASASSLVPLKNTRLRQQPRPESAPVCRAGNAVELTGAIEAPPPPQPRPLSAAPYARVTILSTLTPETR